MTDGPLNGRIILVTRAEEQAAALTDLLEHAGAEVIEVPALEFQPIADLEKLRVALSRLATYDWVLLTSANAVRFLLRQAAELGFGSTTFARCRFAVIGPGTASHLESLGFSPQVIATDSRAEGLLDALRTHLGTQRLTGLKFFLPRAERARQWLPDELRRRGAAVDDVPVYRAAAPQIDFTAIDARLHGRRLDVATFASSATARNFLMAAANAGRVDILAGVRIAAIGPLTGAALRELNHPADILPETYAIPDMVRAIVAHFTRT